MVIFLFASLFSLAQNETPFIEIIVDTPVEVSPISAEFTINLYSLEDQNSNEHNSVYSFDKIRSISFDYEDDITEMEPKNTDDKDEAPESVDWPHVVDLMNELEAAKLSTILIIHRAEDFPDIYDNAPTVDSSVTVVVNNSEDMKRLNAIINTYPCSVELSDIEYENSEKYAAITYPLLTEKAKEQAGILAKSMNRKLGDIIYCSNIISKTFEERMLQKFNAFKFLRDEGYTDDPFAYKETTYVSLNFHFALE